MQECERHAYEDEDQDADHLEYGITDALRSKKDVQLSDAILAGDEKLVKSLLDCQDRSLDIQRGSYVCQAAQTGHIGILLDLLKAGGDPNELSRDSTMRPIHMGASKCHLLIVEVLLCFGCDINQRDSHLRTPMHYLAPKGIAADVEWMLKHGACIDERDLDGYTALHVAACLSNTEFCRGLIQVGRADVNRRACDGWTALHMAASHSRPDTVVELLRLGADPLLTVPEGDTPLHMACLVGSIHSAKLLLKHGVPIDVLSSQGATPLHYARDPDLASFLIRSGASINFLNFPAKLCPLNAAALAGDWTLLSLLLQAGCVTTAASAALLYRRGDICAAERDAASRFPSLTDLCVWRVRGLLAPEMQQRARLLPLPRIVRRHLAFDRAAYAQKHRWPSE